MVEFVPVRWATQEDWDKYRNLIECLYDSMTLAEVIEFMTVEHGIKAT